MTVVAKLGSSIVAADDGELRADVLDSVCFQVAELHAGGEEIALVTSGAIARGMLLAGLRRRPREIDELQAATAGLHTADPRVDPDAALVAEVGDLAELDAYAIGDRTSAFGSGGMRSKVAAAEMSSAAGIPVVICDGTVPGTLAAAAAGEPIG